MSRALRALLLVASLAPLAPSDADALESGTERREKRPSLVVDRCTKGEPPPGTPDVPGGDIFGFLSPTDIGDPCSTAYAAEFTGRAAKRDGHYTTVTKKAQFAYTYSDRLAFAASPFVSAFEWRDVTVNRGALLTTGNGVDQPSLRTFDFDGLSVEASWRVLARAAGQPLAVTLSTEPRWFRRDAVTGFRVDGKQIELKVFADIALSERWFAAFNASYGLGSQTFDIPRAELQQGSAFGVLSALTWQPYKAEGGAVQGIFLGLEARYISGFSGLTMNFRVTEAIFVGPTLAFAFGNGSMLNLVWSPQVWGHSSVASAPGLLELDALEKHQFRLKFATPLPF